MEQPAAKVRTCLWFESQGEEAARLYVSLLSDSYIETISRSEPEGPAQVVELSLAGTPFTFLNGGPHYRLTPAASIAVRTGDQEETDRVWAALVADGGAAGPCGWLTDRFGVSWQIIPEALARMLAAADVEAAGRAGEAMMKMTKIDIAGIARAFAGV